MGDLKRTLKKIHVYRTPTREMLYHRVQNLGYLQQIQFSSILKDNDDYKHIVDQLKLKNDDTVIVALYSQKSHTILKYFCHLWTQ